MNDFRGHSLFPSAACVGRERSKHEWDRCPLYSKYPSPSPGNRSTTGSSSAWDRPGSFSQNCHKEEQEDEEDPDGQPYESDEEDPELARKRKKLQEIEEQIMLKRASLVLKTIDFETVNPGLCCEVVRPIESNETLQDRVKLILMQRNRVIRSKSPVAKAKRNSINIQHDHPLKHRVKVALEQRFVVDPHVEKQHFEEMPFFSAHSQIDSSPAEEGEKGNQGFMRFLNILNKGVDIDKLTEMVIDDTDYITQQPHKSQNGGEMHGDTSTFSSPPENKSQNVGEMHGEISTFSSPEKKNQNDGEMHSETSSPPEKKRQRKEEQPLPNSDEQQEHLQNILESLGLSLGTDEISKLTDRTQERLYGKRQRTKEEDKKEDEPQQTEEEEKYSPAHYTRSSSSSLTSSSSSSPVNKTPSKQSPVRKQRSRSSSRRRRSRSSSHRQRSRSSSCRRRSRSSSCRRRSRSSSHRQRSRSSSHRQRSRSSSHRRRSRSSSRRRRSRSSSHRRRSRSSSHRQRSRSSSRRRKSRSSSRRRRRSVSPYRPRSPRSPCRYRRPSSSPHCHRRSRSPYRRRNSSSSYRGQDSRSPCRHRSHHPRDCRDPLLQFQTPSQPYPYPPSQYFSPHFPPQMYPDHYSQYAAYCNYWAFNHQSIPPLLPHQQIEPHNMYQNAIRTQKMKASRRKMCRGVVGVKMIRPIDPNVKNAQDGTKEINDVIAANEEEKPVLTEEEIRANLKLKLEVFNSRIKKNPTQPAQPLMPQNMKVEDEI